MFVRRIINTIEFLFLFIILQIIMRNIEKDSTIDNFYSISKLSLRKVDFKLLKEVTSIIN
jgi:hypothetical protein